MLAILASSTILIIISFTFEKLITTTIRRKISLATLLLGGMCVCVGGFRVSEAVGFFSSAAVLLLIAFLFGYDRG